MQKTSLKSIISLILAFIMLTGIIPAFAFEEPLAKDDIISMYIEAVEKIQLGAADSVAVKTWHETGECYFGESPFGKTILETVLNGNILPADNEAVIYNDGEVTEHFPLFSKRDADIITTAEAEKQADGTYRIKLCFDAGDEDKLTSVCSSIIPSSELEGYLGSLTFKKEHKGFSAEWSEVTADAVTDTEGRLTSVKFSGRLALECKYINFIFGGSVENVYADIYFHEEYTSVSYIRPPVTDESGFVYRMKYDHVQQKDVPVLLGYDTEATEIYIPAVIEGVALDESIVTENLFNKCDKAESFVVDAANEYFSAADGVLFSKDGKKLIAYPNAKSDKIYNVPETCESLGKGVFDTAINLEDISLSPLMKEINKNAFGGTLTEKFVTVDGLVYFGSLLVGCVPAYVNASSVIAPREGTVNICSGAFNGISGADHELILPSSMKAISSEAGFYSDQCVVRFNDGLTYIGGYNYLVSDGIMNIPESVEHIGSLALGTVPAVVVGDPDCVLETYFVNNADCISGHKGSTAEKYASDNDNIFVPLGEDHVHAYVVIYKKYPSCIEDGVTKFACPCGNTAERTIITPADKDYHEWLWFFPTGKYVCALCGTVRSGSSVRDCSCICHSDDKFDVKDIKTVFRSVMYRIKLLFWRLTGKHKYCECGNRHY